MFEQGLRMAPISGSGLRPSLFTATVSQTRTFHPTLASGASLGKTPSEWYQDAKVQAAQYQELLQRTARIANQTERNRILQWVGNAGISDSPAYRYASVVGDMQTDVEAFTPPNVNAYQVERRQERINKLRSYNEDFAYMVTEAEKEYGRLPDPVVITQERVIGGGTNWTLPLVVGAGAIGVALLVTLLTKK